LKTPLDEIQVDERLNFKEEPVEIMERQFKRLRGKNIAIVKVKWNAKRGPEYTWEPEAEIKRKYPHMFTNCFEFRDKIYLSGGGCNHSK
jgi:hypothetical protein